MSLICLPLVGSADRRSVTRRLSTKKAAKQAEPLKSRGGKGNFTLGSQAPCVSLSSGGLAGKSHPAGTRGWDLGRSMAWGAQDTEACDKGLNHVCENELCKRDMDFGGRDFKAVCGRCQMSCPKCRAVERRLLLGSTVLRSSTNENKACLPLRDQVGMASNLPFSLRVTTLRPRVIVLTEGQQTWGPPFLPFPPTCSGGDHCV